ncbi:hypothetical protein [Enterococcus sp. DIV0876]|uniref:hypothetical protein n=1 Tax=Enterococcus sp. DIV0876 TaxID=2774633 RepID=UPI003D2FC468
MTKRRFSFQHILLAYWLVIVGAYYLYLSLTIMTQHMTLQTLLVSNPLFALGILLTSIMLMQTGSLYYIAKFSQSKHGLLGKYLFILFCQQIITGNLIGAGLIFMCRNQSKDQTEYATPIEKGIVYGSSVISISLSLLVLLILYRT